jgi:hypothetical protein
VKLKSSITDRDVRHLRWLKESLPDHIVNVVVINMGAHAYRRQDGVAVIQLALLTARGTPLRVPGPARIRVSPRRLEGHSVAEIHLP